MSKMRCHGTAEFVFPRVSHPTCCNGSSPLVTSAPSEIPSRTAPRSDLAAIALWLAVGCVIAGVLAMLLSHTPARLRLIGILAGVQGALCGWLLSLTAMRFRMRSPKVALLSGKVLGAGSVALTTMLWWQSHAAQLRANYKPPAGAAMATALLNQAPDSPDSDSAKELDEYRESLKSAGAMPPDTSFSAYLEFRISALSRSRTGGLFLFGFELLLAGFACAGFARAGSTRPFCESCGEWISPVRKCEFTGDQANEVAVLTGSEAGSWTLAAVTLSLCHCPNPRPHFLVVLETAAGNRSNRRSTTDAEAPLPLSAEALAGLNRLIELGIEMR